MSPSDPREMAVLTANSIWAFGATGKFVWPIPDKGLKKRLHRITAPTLIIWGEDDALISSVYAKEFGERIAHSRIEIIKDCGHVPQLEQLETVKSLVANFLDG
jgi:pimeloyl-ACP methyl ester carboxylesterase